MKINVDFGQYEIMDRTSCILSNIEEHINMHHAITKRQQKKVAKAIKLLSEVYQLAGAEVWNDED